MSAIEGFCKVRTELADLNEGPMELPEKIQENVEESWG